MNNLLIYFFKNLVFLRVVSKTFIFFIIFFITYSNNLLTKIIYEKNEIAISEIELTEYKKIYSENYGVDLPKNIAIKNIVLNKKTIKFLEINNPNFILAIDDKIVKEFGKDFLKDNIRRDFLRFLKIRNEFISEYFTYEFKLEDLKNALAQLENLNLPLSTNDCLTIEIVDNLKYNDFFLESLLDRLKNGSNNLQTSINGEIFNVCIKENDFKKIENIIIRYIEFKTQDDFEKFIYGRVV